MAILRCTTFEGHDLEVKMNIFSFDNVSEIY